MDEYYFTPGEAADISGVGLDKQRDWRHRGFLPSNNGKHARYTRLHVAYLFFMNELTSIGFGPTLVAGWASEMVLDLAAWVWPEYVVVGEDGQDVPLERYWVVDFPGNRMHAPIDPHIIETGSHLQVTVALEDFGRRLRTAVWTAPRSQRHPANDEPNALDESMTIGEEFLRSLEVWTLPDRIKLARPSHRRAQDADGSPP